MARIDSTNVSIGTLNTTYGLGNSLGAYKRTSTATKSNTIALVPVSNTVSIGRMRGSFPSGTYRDLDVYASTTTSGINVVPRNPNQAYGSGLSNNSDPSNAYTLQYTQTSGNQGNSNTSNVYRQVYFTYTTDTQSNGMYFRISNVMFPYAGPFEEQGAWVAAIGLNYYYSDINTIYTPVSIFNNYGGGSFYFANFTPSNFAQLMDGNNFIAAFVSGGQYYWGMLNRAQLRAGVIQPVQQISMAGAEGLWWFNTVQNIGMRIGFTSNTGSNQNMDLRVGWDEYIVRGYDLPPEHFMYGQGDTCIRSKFVTPGSIRTIQSRIFE